MRICITKKDIGEGKVNQSDFCPVALAATRAGVRFGYSSAEAQHSTIQFMNEGRVIAERDGMGPMFWFIYKFDRGEAVNPFWFEVEDLPRIQ